MPHTPAHDAAFCQLFPHPCVAASFIPLPFSLYSLCPHLIALDAPCLLPLPMGALAGICWLVSSRVPSPTGATAVRWGAEGRHSPALSPLAPGSAPPTTSGSRVALEGKGLHRRPQQRLDRRLEEVAQAVGGGCCRLQMPLGLALGVRETVAGHRLGALEGGGGVRRQLLGAADTQTAHHATFSTAPAHQRLGSANAETTPAGAPAAAADRKQRPDATCEGKNG